MQKAGSVSLHTRLYRFVNRLFHFHPREFATFLRLAAKWLVLGTLVGMLAGTASAIFLFSLAWATETRLAHPWLLFLLPLAGFAVGWVYWRFGGVASRGNNLVIEEVNSNQSRIPLRMAPLVLAGTIITHLFGGSAGREGTAIQMGASLADTLRRILRLNPADRRLIITAGISGGFASVFGVPVAGFVFGMEVQQVGRIRYDGIIPALVAACVGDLVTRAWGAPHAHYPHMVATPIDALLLLKVVLAAIAFGLTSMLFIEWTHAVKQIQQRITKWTPLYPVIGGMVIIALTLLLGTQDYLGLSLPLIHSSLDGSGVVSTAFLLKLIFTGITLGSGFLGGEVTPLFVIGSTLGYTLGTLLGIDPAFLAAIGFVAVFAGAANTPIACALMGIEMFGGAAALYLLVGCVVAYLASGHRGIYMTQIISAPKAATAGIREGEDLRAVADRSPGWLPALSGWLEQGNSHPTQPILSPHAQTVREQDSLADVQRIAQQSAQSYLPVVNAQGALVGIIRVSDLVPAAGQTAADVMLIAVAAIGQHATISGTLDVMQTENLQVVTVLDGAGRVAGFLTR